MDVAEEVKSVLALAPNWLGDTAMCTPALRALRRKFPNAVLTVAANPACCDLLEDLPWIDGLFRLLPKSSLLPLMRQAKLLAPAGRDLTVVFPHSFRSALLAWFIKSGHRIGYARDGRAPLLTRSLAPHMEDGRITPVYMTHEYLDLVRVIGAEDDGAGLELGVNPAVLETLKPVLAGEGPLIAVAPGAAFGPSKRWMPEAFAETVDILAKQTGARFVLLTGPEEADTRAAVTSHTQTRFMEIPPEIAGIGAMKALLSQCDLLICNDSGPRHVAVAFNKPVVCIMGPTSPLYTDGPYEKGAVIRLDLECSPCQKPVCPLEHHRCMREIPPAQVVEAAMALLSNPQGTVS
ncbi:MAG: lipopolysaccharide heptosyltransferase II [Candidatus Hydrogenedentes bacterium]|mgnify:CR=1 FL=1|nr:lipopolysaccharide heptosyltransferase II [Candidatus Hydrogenedentota bacterium]